MRENTQEGAIIDPAIERREFLRRSAEVVAGTGLITALSAREAVAGVDLNRMKPEEGLKALPDWIKLSSGHAEVKKYPARNPTQLAIMLQTYHFEDRNLDPELHNIVMRSRAETGEMIVELHEKYGVDHFMQEGYTLEEEIVRRIMKKRDNKEPITADDIADIRNALKAIKYYREQRNKPFDANDEPARIERMLKSILPPGIYDKIENGTLDIEVLAAENESTLHASLEDKHDGDAFVDPWTVDLRREQTNLDNAHTRVNDFRVFATIFGPGHWQLRTANMPCTLWLRNQGNRGGRFCCAVIRTPEVIRVQKLIAEGKIDLRAKRN